MRKWVAAALMAASVTAAIAAQGLVPGRTFVFFDWGKPELSGEAKAILDEVAGAYQPGATLRIAGHTDRSGSAAVNRRSARQRAASVRDYLAARGVPAGAMAVESHGEESPIVATEDGVREAQNRRVEIITGAAN